MLIKVKQIGLVNIVADKSIVPELVQYDSTPENIVKAMTKILGDSAYYQQMREQLVGVRARLGETGTSSRVASIVLEFVKG